MVGDEQQMGAGRMSYMDALLVTLCGALFVAAALSVHRGLRSATTRPGPRHVPRHMPQRREEDLVRPTLDAAGRAGWVTQDELPWHEIVDPGTPTPQDE